MNIVAKSEKQSKKSYFVCEIAIDNFNDSMKCLADAINKGTKANIKMINKKTVNFAKLPEQYCNSKNESDTQEGKFDLTAYFMLPKSHTGNETTITIIASPQTFVS